MRPVLIAVLSLVAAAPAASAELLYSNGLADTNSAQGRLISLFRIADDFDLASDAQVTSIRFWMPALSSQLGEDYTYGIYANDSSSLGGLIDTATVGAVPLFLNEIPASTLFMYQVDLDLPAPLSLASGSHWLEVHNGLALTTADDKAVYWAFVAGDPSGNAKSSASPLLPANDLGHEFAFELYGTTLPEPGSTAEASIAIAVLGALRRRER